MEHCVLVTGGNGFIGSWVVRALLVRGYALAATDQPSTHIDHLLALIDDSTTGRPLLPADLLDANSISATSATGMLHVASPYTLADPQAKLVEPVVRAMGALCVVVTSSISAIVPNPGWPSSNLGEPIDERSCMDIAFYEAHKKWYLVSKLLAKEVA